MNSINVTILKPFEMLAVHVLSDIKRSAAPLVFKSDIKNTPAHVLILLGPLWLSAVILISLAFSLVMNYLDIYDKIWGFFLQKFYLQQYFPTGVGMWSLSMPTYHQFELDLSSKTKLDYCISAFHKFWLTKCSFLNTSQCFWSKILSWIALYTVPFSFTCNKFSNLPFSSRVFKTWFIA